MDTEHFDPERPDYPEYADQLAAAASHAGSARRMTFPGGHSAKSSSGVPQLQQLCEGEVVAQKYFVDRLLGRDGLATVAVVRHVELGRRYLLKMVPPEHCAFPEVVARFLRGARAAQALHSEHTARMVDAGRLESGAPYAVSEFLSGAPLGEVLRTRGALSVTDAVDYVLQASESLAEAHLHRLVHKNLSLSKLFLTQQPDGAPLIKVSDYGIANAVRTDPLAADRVGDSYVSSFETELFNDTLNYAAPEQIRSKDVDGRTDIWALGCILHELLTGSAVYRADSASSLLAMIAADPPTPVRALRSDIPTSLEAVVLRCLEKDRSARYPTLGELAAALKPYALPDARGAADRVVRTLSRSAHHAGSPLAMVHVGPAPGQAPSAQRSLPPPLPVLPPPPPRIEPRDRRLFAAVLGGLGVATGVVSALLAVKFSMPAPEATSQSSAGADAELTLQRELVSEIRALRAARQEPTPTESNEARPKPMPAAAPLRPTTGDDRASASYAPAKKERAARARSGQANKAAGNAREPQPSETTADLKVAADAPGGDLFQGTR